jgi:DNA-binding beta-propeller fold protein YncE
MQARLPGETQMHTRYKTVIRITLSFFAISALAICPVIAKLAFPAVPSMSNSMNYEGFISLPKAGTLNVLDYITICKDKLFVTSESDGSVYKVDLSSGSSPRAAIVTSFAGQGAAHGVAIDPMTALAYVTRSETNTVDVFDPNTFTLIKHIPVADDPDGIFYDPASKQIYVASGDAKLVTLIDLAKQETVAIIHLTGKPEFAAFDPQTDLFYQNLEDANTVAAVNTQTRSVVLQWQLPGCNAPSAMAIDTMERLLFIACSQNARLLIFDLDAKRVINSIAIGGGPDAIAFDPALHRLYIAGKSGILSVVRQDSPDKYQLIDSIHTHYGAHTLALDLTSHRVYVGYASLFIAPRLAVFAPKAQISNSE